MESVTEADIHALATPLTASFTRSLNQIADKEMMVQVTLGIPFQMFDATSKALANEDTASGKPGILDEPDYHSKSSNVPDISKEELIVKMREKSLSYESNALNGLLHIINAYRRGFNNTNPQKGPKHEMVLVNKNPLSDIIKSLDEPNRTLPMLKTIFEKLASNIDNYR